MHTPTLIYFVFRFLCTLPVSETAPRRHLICEDDSQPVACDTRAGTSYLATGLLATSFLLLDTELRLFPSWMYLASSATEQKQSRFLKYIITESGNGQLVPHP